MNKKGFSFYVLLNGIDNYTSVTAKAYTSAGANGGATIRLINNTAVTIK